MDRTVFLRMCQKVSVLKNGICGIKENVPNKLMVVYNGIKYYPVAYELYGKNILDEEQMRDILGTKQRSAEIDRESKSRDDDFEL